MLLLVPMYRYRYRNLRTQSGIRYVCTCDILLLVLVLKLVHVRLDGGPVRLCTPWWVTRVDIGFLKGVGPFFLKISYRSIEKGAEKYMDSKGE